jgi:DNA helicase IV
MDQTQKDRLLAETKTDIAAKRRILIDLVRKFEQALAVGPGVFVLSESETALEDEMRSRAAAANATQIQGEMEQLAESPYFARLDVAFDDTPERPYYIAKHSASEIGIYSWTAPVAALRFESPGPVSYRTPLHGQREGQMSRKDQYMIAQGHLNFMTTEHSGAERQLVYQEHFSVRKTGFVLPEVVAQMEKAQDQVVRADHRGPFVISGPAGSGKTTLALHRVAFLRQTPETAELYPPESILVLVQDSGTEDYFSHLLPELGIHDVQITTFARWAISVLGIGDHFYHPRPGRTELERDQYEFAKLWALRQPLPDVTPRLLKEPAAILTAHYSAYLTEAQQGLLQSELLEGALDRYDLTLLLMLHSRAHGGLVTSQEFRTEKRGRRTEIELRDAPLRYALILIDEFQNYMPEQLRLIKSTAGPGQSLVYVGDLAQRTQFGSLLDWRDIGETIAPERTITLQKVYRNTRQILEYIRSQGYNVDIPAGVAEGPEVTEREVPSLVEALQYITSLTRVPGAQLGIIAQDPRTLDTYRDYFASDDSVHCLTMRAAQGVEFDQVVLLTGQDDGIDWDDADLAAEQMALGRDLMYVALTRAMTELHVLHVALR